MALRRRSTPIAQRCESLAVYCLESRMSRLCH